MKKNKMILCITACAAVLTLAGCAKTKPQAAQNNAAAEEAVFTVKSQSAEIKDLYSYIATNGSIEANRQIEVFPDIGGKLIEVSVALGSKVKKGQVIAQIDPSVPGSRYSASPVTAPISGYITSVPLQIGTTVSVSSPIAVIGDIEDLQVSVNIPERFVAVLKTGLKAEMTLEAFPAEKFLATVIRVSPVVDSVSRTKEVQLAIDTVDPRINAGMFPKIKLYTTITPNAVTIPQASIVSNFGSNYVFVVNGDSTVSRREITQGVTVDGVTQITSGVSAGERVVVQGMQILSDGVKVKDLGATVTGGSR